MRPAWNAWRLGLGLGLLVALSTTAGFPACSKARKPQIGDLPCTTFSVETQPILFEQCSSCHTGSTPQGGYSVDTYEAAIARRPDGAPRANADENALVLDAARGALPGHQAIPEEQQGLLRDWLVRCAAQPRPYGYHESGLLDPGNGEDFHGHVLRRRAYDLSECQTCHGRSLEGGTAAVACSTCHTEDWKSCRSCHGDTTSAAPPMDLEYLSSTSRVTVGAHRAHVAAGPRHAAYGCSSCHPPVPSADADGHYRRGDAPDESPAEVRLKGTKGIENGTWNREAATCANAYCHAPTQDNKATHQMPVWTRVGSGQDACGSCHGLPPESHRDTPYASAPFGCPLCHRPAFSGSTLQAATHVNGLVEISQIPGTCVGCHGSGTNPAPPNDLSGNTATTSRGVGAHRAHVQALRRLSRALVCVDCHPTPTTVMDPGHIDSTLGAEVLPNVAEVGTLAKTDDAPGTYNATDATCAVYCHGAGAALIDDANASNRSPTWTGGETQSRCGTCHGNPPSSPTHVTNNVQPFQCTGCHRLTMPPAGGFDTTRHINGQLEVNAP